MNNKITQKTNTLLLDNKKSMHTQLDLWALPLLLDGVIFFNLKIKMVGFYLNSNFGFIAGSLENQIETINYIVNGVAFCECGFGCIELNEDGEPLLNCVFGFRSHFNSINYINERIRYLFGREFGDFILTYLPKFEDVSGCLRYISRDFDKIRPYPLGFVSQFSNFFADHHFQYFEQFFLLENKNVLLLFSANNENYWRGCAYDFKGVSAHLAVEPYFEPSYYLMVYFIKFELILVGDRIYKKIKESALSYKYVGKESYIVENFNFFMVELSSNYPFSFIDIRNLTVLFLKYEDKVIAKIKKLFGFSKKILSLNLLEFKDVLYFASSNIFIHKRAKNLINLGEKYFTKNFYKDSYKNLYALDNEPKFWKKNIIHNFTEKEFKILCLLMRNLFFITEESIRINILLSNIRKSPLTIDIVIKIWGVENVNDFCNNSEILFKNIEFTENFLAKPILEMAHYQYLTFQVLGAYTYVCPDVNSFLNDPILQSKIWRFIFNNGCILSKEEINKILEEIPKIIIYCNEVHFEFTGVVVSNKMIETIKKSILSPVKKENPFYLSVPIDDKAFLL